MFWKTGAYDERSRFGPYYVVKLIHDAEKSTVYTGEEMPGKPPVAIKLYKPRYDKLARQLEKKYGLPSEGETGLALNPRPDEDAANRPIVRTLAHGTEYGRRNAPRYIIMEFAEGYNLKNLITVGHELVRKWRPRIILQLARALKIVHDRGMIFRDFCPDNVVLSPAGAIRLIDLGFVAPAGIRFEEKSGTPSYMSPEQIRCEPLGVTTDIYSFGIFLYELIVGRPPYQSTIPGDTVAAMNRRFAEVMDMHLNAPVPAVPPALRAEAGHLAGVIERCLRKKAADRYATMAEVLDALV